jgi:uncharacterized damage-inducible protein DinB
MSDRKRRAIVRASALAVFGACVPSAWTAQLPRLPRQGERAASGRSFVAELLDEFKLSHTYTMECAQSMPEKEYDFRPAPEERSFGQQMVHIAEALQTLYQMHVEERLAPEQPFSEAGMEPVKSKLDVLHKLESAYTVVEKGMAKLSDGALDKRVELLGSPASKLRVLHFLLDHTAHHRGEAVVYMRIKGVKPPVFRA